MTALFQSQHQFDHLGNVVRGPGIVLGGLDSQRAQIFEEGVGIPIREFPQRDSGFT